jgi:hypothetical protein
MRSSKVGIFEVPDMEPSSMMIGLLSSSSCGGGSTSSSLVFDIVSPSD